MNNKIEVIGRVTKEFKLGTSAKGTPYIRLNVASDGPDGTVWYNVVVFKTMAQLLFQKTGGAKGGEFKFFGPLTKKEYQKKDGSLGVSNDLIADQIWLEGGEKLDKFTPYNPENAREVESTDFPT